MRRQLAGQGLSGQLGSDVSPRAQRPCLTISQSPAWNLAWAGLKHRGRRGYFSRRTFHPGASEVKLSQLRTSPTAILLSPRSVGLRTAHHQG